MSTKYGLTWKGIIQTRDEKPLQFDSFSQAITYLESINESEDANYIIFPFPGAFGTMEPQPTTEPTVKFVNNNGDITYLAGSSAVAEFTMQDGSKITVRVSPTWPQLNISAEAGLLRMTADAGNHIRVEAIS